MRRGDECGIPFDEIKMHSSTRRRRRCRRNTAACHSHAK